MLSDKEYRKRVTLGILIWVPFASFILGWCTAKYDSHHTDRVKSESNVIAVDWEDETAVLRLEDYLCLIRSHKH